MSYYFSPNIKKNITSKTISVEYQELGLARQNSSRHLSNATIQRKASRV